MPPWPAYHLFLCFLIISSVNASITVYKNPFAAATETSSLSPTATLLAAFNDTVLQAPSIPSDPKPPNEISLELPVDANALVGMEVALSIQQTCAFWGFSIEMSVVTQVLGKNSTFIQVPFLNLMQNIAQHSGCVRVRTGGNTQEFARYSDTLTPGSYNTGAVVVKQDVPGQNPTETPTLLFNLDYFYLLGNISTLVNVGWFLGIPMNDTNTGSPIRLEIAEYSQQVLGDRLLGLQVGNEPDLYTAHNHRPLTYSPYDYFREFGLIVRAIKDNPRIGALQNHKLIGPSVATGAWTPEMVWDTGFIDAYGNDEGLLGGLAVEHYPDDNCFALYGASVGQPKELQSTFSNYLNHTSARMLVGRYLNSSRISVDAGLPLFMLETNTASCGGFPGISDSFGAALWMLDYGLQMAWGNFSGSLMHVGGRDVFYNPFTPPPTNESLYHQWTIGASYYAALITAEVFGSSNKSRIVDLQAQAQPNPFNPSGDATSIYQPQYAIYDGDTLARIALFNFVTDASGESDYFAKLRFSTSGQTVDQVFVKYFLSDSVSTKNNITWAGQTLGTKYNVDGRLRPSSPTIQTISCTKETASPASICQVRVPAPGFALIFLPSYSPDSSEPKTFSTTAYTRTHNTATVDPSVLATSNGNRGGLDGADGSTSWKISSASRLLAPSVGYMLIAMSAGFGFRVVLSFSFWL
ncbi:glycoside hydrolase family 79 protein [Moniliophthora roreri MCA 2997]|uniref:Glycoside hydrolase family 79 protein n=1 Tax=Moniliophthora roreri (strain MCA 2997) TaxID=1381753 RepID=V2XQ78_MONRO|nr:glycoside hydrolase family 79 protein [Moniliophthora roreri MCA 2997]